MSHQSKLYISMSQHSGLLYFLTSKRWANWIHQCESLKLCGHTVRITGNKFILMLCNKYNKCLNNKFFTLNTNNHPLGNLLKLSRKMKLLYARWWSKICTAVHQGSVCVHQLDQNLVADLNTVNEWTARTRTSALRKVVVWLWSRYRHWNSGFVN